MDFPLVTIGITCYNAEDTIERALQSAINQDWPNLEIVIVDDGSTDGSHTLIEKYAVQDNRIKFIPHETNSGFPAALNTILRNAEGEYVAFFDDDDESVSDRITKQYQRIVDYKKQTNAELILCYSNRNIVRAGESKSDHIAYAIGRKAPEPYGIIVAEYILGYANRNSFVWGLFGSGTLILSRVVFERIGIFDTVFRRSAEMDMAIRAAFLGAHFIAVDEPLMIQYKTPGVHKSADKVLYYNLLLRKKHQDYLKRQKVYRMAVLYAYTGYFNKKRWKFFTFVCLLICYILYPKKILYKMQYLLGKK